MNRRHSIGRAGGIALLSAIVAGATSAPAQNVVTPIDESFDNVPIQTFDLEAAGIVPAGGDGFNVLTGTDSPTWWYYEEVNARGRAGVVDAGAGDREVARTQTASNASSNDIELVRPLNERIDMLSVNSATLSFRVNIQAEWGSFDIAPPMIHAGLLGLQSSGIGDQTAYVTSSILNARAINSVYVGINAPTVDGDGTDDGWDVRFREQIALGPETVYFPARQGPSSRKAGQTLDVTFTVATSAATMTTDWTIEIDSDGDFDRSYSGTLTSEQGLFTVLTGVMFEMEGGFLGSIDDVRLDVELSGPLPTLPAPQGDGTLAGEYFIDPSNPLRKNADSENMTWPLGVNGGRSSNAIGYIDDHRTRAADGPFIQEQEFPQRTIVGRLWGGYNGALSGGIVGGSSKSILMGGVNLLGQGTGNIFFNDYNTIVQMPGDPFTLVDETGITFPDNLRENGSYVYTSFAHDAEPWHAPRSFGRSIHDASLTPGAIDLSGPNAAVYGWWQIAQEPTEAEPGFVPGIESGDVHINTVPMLVSLLIQTENAKWYRSSDVEAYDENFGIPPADASLEARRLRMAENRGRYEVASLTWERVSAAAEANMNVMDIGGEVPLGPTQPDPGPNLAVVTGMGILLGNLHPGVQGTIALCSLVLEGEPAVTPTPTPTPTPPFSLDLDFKQISVSEAWLPPPGVIPIAPWNVSHDPARGICMTVEGPGDNISVLVSPDRLVPLIDRTVYRARLHVNTDQTATDAIPLFNFMYDNFHSGFGAYNYGGERWVWDASGRGGANGIGRPQGRDVFEFWFAPLAMELTTWRTENPNGSTAFDAAADDVNDMRVIFRVLDLGGGDDPLRASEDFGTICVERLTIEQIPLVDILGAAETIYAPPLHDGEPGAGENPDSPDRTHFANTFDNIANFPDVRADIVGGEWRVTLPAVDPNVGYAFARLGPDVVAAGPLMDPPGGVGLPNPLRLYPIPWETDAPYAIRVATRNAGTGADPPDVIILNYEAFGSELGGVDFVVPSGRDLSGIEGRTGADGGGMVLATAPSFGKAEEYLGFFHGNNTTLDPESLAGSDGWKAQFDLFNRADLGGPDPFASGRDTVIVESLEVDRIALPPPGN